MFRRFPTRSSAISPTTLGAYGYSASLLLFAWSCVFFGLGVLALEVSGVMSGTRALDTQHGLSAD